SGLAERGAGLEREGNGDGGQLAGVRDALRAGVGDHFGDGAQGNHVAVVALHVDQVEPVGVFLVGGQHFEQHAVLIGGRVDGGRELGAEGVVEGAGNGIPVEVQGGGAVAVEDDVDARGLDLQIAGDFLQAGQAADEALEFGGFGVELRGIGAVEGVIEAALGHASADADGGGNGDGNAQAGDAGEFGAGAIDDIGHGGFALPPREQVDHQAAGGAGGSEVAATGHGVETLHVGILHDDGRDQFLIFDHLVIRGALGGFQGDGLVFVVGVGNDPFGTITKKYP